MINNINKWDYRFFDMAKLVATWSKDPKKKVGSVIVLDRRIIGTGYNGFPKGLSDSLNLYEDREFKNKHVVHAEANAIYNCPIKPVDGTLYCTYSPCLSCCLSIIQSGIIRVVSPEIVPGNWYSNQMEAKEYMKSAGLIIDNIKLTPEYSI